MTQPDSQQVSSRPGRSSAPVTNWYPWNHESAMISATLGAALTGFYFVHESLPRAIRAPTSLILASVAVVDGVCYAIGVPGIYGRPAPVLLVNWSFCGCVLRRAGSEALVGEAEGGDLGQKRRSINR